MVREDEGDCLLRTFERSFLRIRCGIMVGMEGGHEKGSLTLEKSFREGKEDFLMVLRPAGAKPGGV